MEYIATHPIYYHWWPIFTVFLGTGCRIGEVLGLRWEDINYEKRIICVNHNLTYYPVGEDRASENHISTPKTEAGMRTIPMLDAVKDAFEMIWEEQKEKGWTDAEIDGMTGFIFCNRYGKYNECAVSQSGNQEDSFFLQCDGRSRSKKRASRAGAVTQLFGTQSETHFLHKAL